MKPRFYAIIENCVAAGALIGYHRAHKHVDAPTPDAIAEAITDAVMNQLCGSFEFDDPL